MAMDRMGHDNSTADRILAGDRRAVVVPGPAGSGKTAAALAVWRRLRDEAGRGCVLVAPNAAGVTALRDRALASEKAGVIVSPEIMTFAALAGRVLLAAGVGAPVQSAFRRQLVLRRIVNDLCQAGELTALAGVADTPGLIVTLDRSIGELKRAAVEPDALAAALGEAGRGKGGDLVAIYRRYQEHLLATGLYDVEGRMWLVRDLLAGVAPPAERRAFDPEIPAVVVDGFTDFTPTQLAILRLLARRGARVVITLPWADDGRGRMWHWTRRTLNNIRAAFGADLDEITLGPPAGPTGRFAPILRGLFDFDAEHSDAPEGLALIAAAGIDAEVSAVARRVKRLLVDGAPAGSIAVLVRSTDVYRGEIERVFGECDIPVSSAARPLADVPVIRFALDAASLGPDWAFGDVLRAIKSSYFSPAALGPFDETTVAVAEMLIREGNVLAGRDDYATAAARLARRAAARPALDADADGDDERDAPTVSLGPLAVWPEAITQAASMLEALFDLAASAVADGGGGADGLRRIIDGLDLLTAARGHREADLVARDLRALAALDSALAELASVEQAGMPVPHEIADALSAVSCPPARGEALVNVMSVLDARAVRCDHVFLLGLGEGQFPGRPTENSLIGEAERKALASRGVVLDARADLNAREMLLFYLGVSRADTSLTLSYLSADASGRPGAPGSFLLSLLRSIGGADSVPVETVTPGSLVPAPSRIASRRDALNAGIAGLFHSDLGDCGAALSWAARNVPGPVARAAGGLWAHSRRWTAGPCDTFDGRITETPLLASLAQRFSDEAVFSARRLDTFGQCPWQFFAQYVLKLVDLPRPRRMLEPTGRGLFCHDVLCRAYRLLGERFGLPVRLGNIDEAAVLAALDDAVTAASDQVEAQGPPYPMLWRIQREQMRRELRWYMLRQRDEDAMPAESTYFELAFGMGDSAGGADPASRGEPVEIDIDESRTLRVKGRIDRVDRVTFDGDEGLLVVDYKTGALPGVDDILAGRNVQAPLYAAVVERIFGGEAFGGVFHRVAGNLAERYFARVKRHGGNISANSAYGANRDETMARVGLFVRAMQAGRFDLTPTRECSSYCPFRSMCQYSRPRAELKAPAVDERGQS